MLPFSSAVSNQIRFLLQSFNDSNFDSIFRELCQFINDIDDVCTNRISDLPEYHKDTRKNEKPRWILLIRLCRLYKLKGAFNRMDNIVWINYKFTRISKLATIIIYWNHIAACIFYYLATAIPPCNKRDTWIGNVTLGQLNFTNFREKPFVNLYYVSAYWSITTMTTMCYGDVHPANCREMIFAMLFQLFSMILSAYLIAHLSSVLMKSSKTEIFRGKMLEVIDCFKRNDDTRETKTMDQIKGELMKYGRSYTDAALLQDFPISLRDKIVQKIYRPFIENDSLFEGCSTTLINQIFINDIPECMHKSDQRFTRISQG